MGGFFKDIIIRIIFVVPCITIVHSSGAFVCVCVLL